jgi:16S rRNA (guanine966-N2)-methyltransferase
MRVIAGEHKGRQIKAVPGKTTRPTSDKVKEAVFQVMGPFFEGGICLDLFAGSGSLGIEALSRGMDQAVFVDKQPGAIHTIHENLKTLQLEEVSEVFRTDAFRALHAAAKRRLRFDLILIDPPYKKAVYEKMLDEIAALDLAAPNAIIYCEHDTSGQPPPAHKHFDLLKQGNYGGTTGVTIYRRAEGGKRK